MTPLQRRVLSVLAQKGPQTPAEISEALGGDRRGLTMSLRSIVRSGWAELGYRKQSEEYTITEKGRDLAAKPEPPPPPVKSAWDRLDGRVRTLLRYMKDGRTVYKRVHQYPCLESPLQPFDGGAGLAMAIEDELVDCIEGDLRRAPSAGWSTRRVWLGEWGRFQINQKGKDLVSQGGVREPS